MRKILKQVLKSESLLFSFILSLFFSLLLTSCVSRMVPAVSLSFKFGDCLGGLDEPMSCSRRLFSGLSTDIPVGCWLVNAVNLPMDTNPASAREERAAYSQLVKWSGEEFTLVRSETIESFPFEVNERVDVGLFVFSDEVTEERCASLTLESACELDAGCRMQIRRQDVLLRYNEPLNLQGPIGSCDVETPGINQSERCDTVDNDCDGRVDETLNCTPLCVEGTVESCETRCGLGEMRCVEGVYQECIPLDTQRERCDALDNDCDGEIDELLSCEQCREGMTRACDTPCGMGRQICIEGIYGPCHHQREMTEVCGGGDEDCDGSIDELLACPACQEGETRSCTTICGMGQERCVAGSYQGCNAPVPTPEICDTLDNDCDEKFDEDTEKGEVCMMEEDQCARPGTYECTVSGPLCSNDDPTSNQMVEICNGLDDDCNGVDDDVLGVGEWCEVSGATCAWGKLECPPLGPNNGDLVCVETEDEPTEICDQVDNDCDGEVDEGEVCGQLLYERCKVSLGWALLSSEPDIDQTWDQFPPTAPSCVLTSQVNADTYSCNVAERDPDLNERDSNFRVLDVASAPGAGHWLGLAWRCDFLATDTENITEPEIRFINTVKDHCTIGLGYAKSRALDLQRSSCETYAPISADSNANPNVMQRCAQISAGHGYLGVELGSLREVVNENDQLGIAFGCDPPESNVSEHNAIVRQIVIRASQEFQVFLGSRHDTTNRDNQDTWDKLPEFDIDNGSKERGAGTPEDGTFGSFDLERDDIKQFSIFTRVREAN